MELPHTTAANPPPPSPTGPARQPVHAPPWFEARSTVVGSRSLSWSDPAMHRPVLPMARSRRRPFPSIPRSTPGIAAARALNLCRVPHGMRRAPGPLSTGACGAPRAARSGLTRGVPAAAAPARQDGRAAAARHDHRHGRSRGGSTSTGHGSTRSLKTRTGTTLVPQGTHTQIRRIRRTAPA